MSLGTADVPALKCTHVYMLLYMFIVHGLWCEGSYVEPVHKCVPFHVSWWGRVVHG